jgi:hypothetical protein
VCLICVLQLRASTIALDEANQQMRAKLESSLKDEVVLLEQIQQLESAKASKEAQLAAATDDAARAVSYFSRHAKLRLRSFCNLFLVGRRVIIL